jgi:hypothetical protein
VDLNPVAVELDLVDPAISPLGTLSSEEASAGSIKPGQLALVPIAAGFLRWIAKAQLDQKGKTSSPHDHS